MGRPRKGLNGYTRISGDFIERNKTVLVVGCRKHIEKVAKPELVKILTRIAETMVDMIDGAFGPINPPSVPFAGNSDFPVWFGQLHDATGVAIYNDGAVARFLPTKKALDSQPQSIPGVSHIIGSQWLDVAIKEASGQCSEGLWIVLFSSVPYAAKINASGSKWGRGVAYFDRMSDKELADILFDLEMNPIFELVKK